MFRDIRKNRIFNRRALIVGATQSGLAAVLLARLSYLQLWKYKEYSVQADSNRIKPVINPAPRGIVFDRNGEALTKNDGSYRLLLYLEHKRNNEELVEKIAKILDLKDETKEVLLAKVKNARRKTIISLIDNLGWDDLARIETNLYSLPGAAIESGVIRRYPYPFETAHFLGYVSLPSEKEVDESKQGLFMHPSFRVGKAGLEKTFDDSLRGKYGVEYVEVNVYEMPIRTLSTKAMVEGSQLNLTIDLSLQQFVTERIKKDVASVVVMDVKTGEILSYASSPSFNPNNFVEGVSKEYWQELTTDPRKPLNNKPIAAAYPPGSTFKTMVALAALENGVNPKQRVYCNGGYKLGNRVFHCWKEEGHGSVNMVDAIAQSCNTYFFTIANQIGYKKIAEMARRFGYGEKFDINLYGARSGNIPDEKWKEKVYGQEWFAGDTLNAAIGQGFLLATPLQMAVATSRIANGGIPIKPHLVKNHNISEQYDSLQNSALVKKSHLKLVQEGMRQVVNDSKGTAYWRRIREKGFEMAGKSGTSQVISKREEHMSEYEKKMSANHAIFVAFAPVNEPKYAISVVVEHGGGGSAAAAPIARDVMLKVQNLNKDLA